ncbi:MAG: glycogen debranching protein GlgX [Rhodocyclaceae bacterium]|nr:glycogen debranching protein GlgX [Rhodocyclaceae bacterium]
MSAPPAAVLGRGRPYPLGARCDGAGVNFAVFSAHATQLELCLFDAAGELELSRHALYKSGDIWHGHLAGAGAGLVYGLRAHGPWRPHEGLRFNPAKLLLDPYARRIVGEFVWSDAQLGHDAQSPQLPSALDNAAEALKAVVVAGNGHPGDDFHATAAAADMVVYELHVRGATMLHPAIPEPLRGTYAGLACPAMIEHLQGLGVNAVELMPVQQHLDERRLVAAGLSNYWGYNTVGFFCPEPRYAADPQHADEEFRAMVRAFHAAGIAVILDVVYNHSAETDEVGATIAWRGLDNRSYYKLRSGRAEAYENLSGCGNAFNTGHPRVLQMVTDSLRYWVEHMHVDGFRFDLATVLGRGYAGYDTYGPMFAAIAQDPVLARTILIAEPWDLGMGGYRLGQFPIGWREWNDKFRDTIRAWWLGGPVSCGEFARRLCASSELFDRDNRAPWASLNFITAHDGFTLADLLAYDHKHNQANGESNQDGHDRNLSWNCGEEGPSARAEVLAVRARLARSLLATLMLAQGTPMLLAGDELGNSQGGNNNAYCQDNPTAWLDWNGGQPDLYALLARLAKLRRELAPLDGNHWYKGSPRAPGEPTDLAWRRADGAAMEVSDWHGTGERRLQMLIGAPGKSACPMLLLFNADAADFGFVLPPGRWQVLLDTAQAAGLPQGGDGAAPVSSTLNVSARTVALLQSSD